MDCPPLAGSQVKWRGHRSSYSLTLSALTGGPCRIMVRSAVGMVGLMFSRTRSI
jgi:hypothetical protein